MAETDLKEARLFLSNIHGATVDDGGMHLTIWTRQDRATRSFRSVDEAAAYAVERANAGLDVYHGICPLKNAPKPGSRGTVAEVGAMNCFWLDVDVAGPDHKSEKQYFPTIEDATSWLRSLKHHPSIIVHSGHGAQAYWLFEQPFVISTEEDRAKAIAIASTWVYDMSLLARFAHCDLDPVGDLARVFRVVGTVNVKSEPHMPVKFIEHTWTLVSMDELVPKPRTTSAVPEFPTPGVTAPGAPRPATSTPAAAGATEVPADGLYPRKDVGTPLVINRLCDADRQFKQTWNHKRKQFKSASEYDMSLCSQMLIFDCTHQDIADAVFAWRTIHNENIEKLFRKPGTNGTYIDAMIKKCIETKRKCDIFGDDLDTALNIEAKSSPEGWVEKPIAKLETPQPASPPVAPPAADVPPAAAPDAEVAVAAAAVATEVKPPKPSSYDRAKLNPELLNVTPEARAAFDFLSEKLEVKILNITQLGEDNPTYNMILQNSRGPVSVLVGTPDEFTHPVKVRNALLGHKIMMPDMKRAQWMAIVRHLVPHIQVVESNVSDRQNEYSAVMEEYLSDNRPHPYDERLNAIRGDKPFLTRESQVGIYLVDALRFTNVRMLLGEKVGKHQFSDGITQLGFRIGVAEVKQNKVHLRRSYWFGPYNE